MKRTVTVLQDDIDNGLRKRTSMCMVALAAKRDLADLGLDDVYAAGHLRLLDASGRVIYRGKLPRHVVFEMSRFDGGGEVAPFKFEVELEEGS